MNFIGFLRNMMVEISVEKVQREKEVGREFAATESETATQDFP